MFGQYKLIAALVTALLLWAIFAFRQWLIENYCIKHFKKYKTVKLDDFGIPHTFCPTCNLKEAEAKANKKKSIKN